MIKSQHPVRAWDVKAFHFPPTTVYARTRASARMQAYRNFTEVYDCAFLDFAAQSTVRLSPVQPVQNKRVMILGRPATLIASMSDNHRVHFIYEGEDRILPAHPSEVSPAP